MPREILEFTVSINPCTECYIDNFIKGTTLTVFFSGIIARFANTAVRESERRKHTYGAVLVSFHGVKF